MKWWDQMPWSSFSECWALSQLFHSPLSLSSRGFLVPLPLSAIRVVSSAYLRWLIFLPAILIQACASSSPVFLMMNSAQKLNKQGDNIQPRRTPFPIWNQSVVPCPVLTVASWPAYRFLKRLVVNTKDISDCGCWCKKPLGGSKGYKLTIFGKHLVLKIRLQVLESNHVFCFLFFFFCKVVVMSVWH